MSISSISSVSSYQANQVNWQNNSGQFQQDFNALASALNSNNLSAAQSAFTALQQLLPNSSTTGIQTQTAQQGSGQNTIAADLSALGQALNSTNPNMQAAQTAFAKLQADMQSVGGTHHHHHHHHKASASTQSTASTTSSSSDGSNTGTGGSGTTQNASGGSSFSVYA